MDFSALWGIVLPHIPAQYAGMASAFVAFLMAFCAWLSKKWQRPPDGSKWLWLYKIVNIIGQNSSHATNADDVQK